MQPVVIDKTRVFSIMTVAFGGSDVDVRGAPDPAPTMEFWNLHGQAQTRRELEYPPRKTALFARRLAMGGDERSEFWCGESCFSSVARMWEATGGETALPPRNRAGSVRSCDRRSWRPRRGSGWSPPCDPRKGTGAIWRPRGRDGRNRNFGPVVGQAASRNVWFSRGISGALRVVTSSVDAVSGSPQQRQRVTK